MNPNDQDFTGFKHYTEVYKNRSCSDGLRLQLSPPYFIPKVINGEVSGNLGTQNKY